MKHDMLNVSFTRTTQHDFFNLCKIKCHKPCVGYIYRYPYVGASFIGAADIEKRCLEHEANTTNISCRVSWY